MTSSGEKASSRIELLRKIAEFTKSMKDKREIYTLEAFLNLKVPFLKKIHWTKKLFKNLL